MTTFDTFVLATERSLYLIKVEIDVIPRFNISF